MHKKIGFFFIFLGILITIMLFMFKAREDYYIELYVKNEGTCFLEDGTCLHEDRNFLVYIFGSILSVGLIVLGVYLILYDKLKKAEITKKSDNVFDEKKLDLLPDEKIVFSLIKENNTIFQSELVEKTKYSKVKITRILDKLESRGLIERKRRGMTNVVILKN